MSLDIRLPIGLLFACIGILLAAFGLLSDPALYRRSLGYNINLGWGLVMLAFGIIMIVLGRRGAAPRPDAEPLPPATPPR